MIFIVILLLIMCIALSNIQINQQFARDVLQDGQILSYTDLQRKYPLVPMQSTRPIYVFFHICTQGEHWKSILESQMQAIIQSGLYDKCHTVWYGCSCHMCVPILKEYFVSYDKVKPLPHAQCGEVKSYENMTLNSMIRFCRSLTYEADCLYIHTKGTSAKSQSQHAWRDYMMHWLVHEHDIALDLLHRGFFTVGTLYQYIPITIYGYKRLYSGNFFWVTSTYMKSLPIINNIGNRFEAEQLLFKHYTPGKHVGINTDVFASLYIPWKTGLYRDPIELEPKDHAHLQVVVV